MEQFDGLDACALCPRACGANRNAGARGVCGAGAELRVARAMLHQWEEPPISGSRGSGAVFFAYCPLHCVYCQNAELSRGKVGKVIETARLARIFLELQEKGAHNINLVTPTQYVPQIKAALDIARADGLGLPVVYNTSGYETVETIRCLAGYVDIYLTDFKYAASGPACRYSTASDYFEAAAAALTEMVAQVGPYRLDDVCTQDATVRKEALRGNEPLLEKGVIVRHLLLPGGLDDAKTITKYVHERFGDKVCLSLMNQYTPLPGVEKFEELRSPVSEEEYCELIDYALDIGVENSFMQEGGTVTESFIPAFDNEGV